MKKLTDYFLYSSFFIALCAAGLVLETYLLTQLTPDFRLAALIFCATLFLYNLDGLLPYKTAQQTFISEKKSWLLTHRKFIIGLTVMAGAGALALCWQLSTVLPVGFLLPFFVISVLYSFPLLPAGTGKIPLRDIPYLKVFLIALVWSGLTVFLPLVIAGENITAFGLLVLGLRRFLFIFALTLLFDIRDRAKDAFSGTITFPVKFGNAVTRMLAVTALVLFIVFVHFQESSIRQYALEASAVLAAAVVYYARENRPEYYFAVLADGMMLLQFLLVWVFA